MTEKKSDKPWVKRSHQKISPIFPDPEDLWKAAVEYFEWVERTPKYENKLVSYMGVTTVERLPLERPMTISGLCIFIGVPYRTWWGWSKENTGNLAEMCDLIQQIITNQKFEGAALNLFNANLISRELGIADRLDFTSSDGTMSPHTETQDAVMEILRNRHDEADS